MNKKKAHKPFKLMFVIMKKKIISGATVLYSWLKYLKIFKDIQKQCAGCEYERTKRRL